MVSLCIPTMPELEILVSVTATIRQCLPETVFVKSLIRRISSRGAHASLLGQHNVTTR